MNKEFPEIENLIEFADEFYNYDNCYGKALERNYKKIVEEFKSPVEFLEKIQTNCTNRKYKTCISIFLTLKCRIFIFGFIDKIKPFKLKEKLIYFGIVDERLKRICEEESKLIKSKDSDFYKYLIKTLAFFKIEKINEINVERIKELNANYFSIDIERRRRYILFLDKVMALYYLKGNKSNVRQDIMDNLEARKHGTDRNCIIKAIDRYIGENYIAKNYNGDSFLKNIRIFFKWIHNKYKYIGKLDNIRKLHINEYYKYVKELDVLYRTKWERCNYVFKFFIWTRDKEYTSIDVSNIRHGIKSISWDSNDNPKMFQNRQHFNQVLAKIQKYVPVDEQEFLFKSYILVLMGTGFRISEGVWLDSNCIQERVKVSDKSNKEIGEIILRTKDKIKMVNKRTSILPWGLKSLDDLIDRFNNRENTLIYNEKLGEYTYSLFEYKGKLISISKLSNFLKKKVFDELEFKDENGKVLDYKNIKSHAFRHQKFNDIYDVTDGNLTRVKQDSNHRTIRMAKRYTKQAKKKQINKITQSIEHGKISGKGAEILKALVDVNMLPEQYLESLEKLSITEFYTIDYIVENLKFLGFGFCTGKCKWSHLCEGCKYFITDEEYLTELQIRYSINYMITMELIRSNGMKRNGVRKNLVSLRNQEKILEQLGMTYEEIKRLRVGEGILDVAK